MDIDNYSLCQQEVRTQLILFDLVSIAMNTILSPEPRQNKINTEPRLLYLYNSN